MSLSMSVDERQSFLAEPHIGVISLNEPGRGPLTAPIWYDYTPGGELWVVISPTSRKGRLVSMDARIALVAQQEAMPYKYVSVEGPIVSMEPSAEGDLLAMAQRYLGAEQGSAYASASTEDNLTVRMRPERWLTVDYGKMGAL